MARDNRVNILDKLFSKCVLERDGYKCQFPGCNETATDPHHFITRANKATRWELINGIALCRNHHTLRHAGNYPKDVLFKVMIDKYGEKWEEKLYAAHRLVFKYDHYESKKEELKCFLSKFV